MYLTAVLTGLIRAVLILRILSAPPIEDSIPSATEQAGIIAAAREEALNFTAALPNFICTQVTRRWVGSAPKSSVMIFNPTARMAREPRSIQTPSDDVAWKLKDTLTIQLSYFGQNEQYKLLLLNGKRTNQTYESVDGARSYGDFGNVLGIVFQQSAHATFTWNRWAMLNGQRVMVFDFSVLPADSQWRIGYESQETVTGMKGRVFIVPASKRVSKIEVNATDIPKKFPVQRSGIVLDYRMQLIGEREYELPLRAEIWNDAKGVSTKNDVEFRLYRKFEANSTINFETPAPLPASQINETPPE